MAETDVAPEEEAAAMAPRRLVCTVQTYDWGRKGEHSTVARLFSKNSGTPVDGGKPYAELWMGTHPSGPSFLGTVAVAARGDAPQEGEKGMTLKKWIEGNPSVLGKKVAERWGGDLPFLFKVLSVDKALSIQAHPDKVLARKLHEQQPSVYKDNNHKPEMALALTEFQALCGFVSLAELKDVLITVPEIAEVVGNEEIAKVLGIKEQDESDKAILQLVFTRLMSASKEVVSDLVSKLKSRLKTETEVRTLTHREKLALVLEKQYPADVGVLASFFLNYVKLNPGEALYLGANEPHAYLSGECIECMATSDNVVRAGLTPKYRDVQTLCSMLTYKQGFPEILRGVPLNAYVSRYIPPFDEFEVDHCSLPFEKSVVLPEVLGPSLVIVVAGEGRMQVTSSAYEDKIMEGNVFFIPAGIEISLTADSAGALQLYRAGVNSTFLESSS